MSETGISTTGIPAVLDLLQEQKKDVLRSIPPNLTRVGFYMEREVKASIAGQRDEPPSVDTGQFMGSVTSEVTESDGEWQVVIFTQIDYAKFLESGTSRMTARAHFQNSLERSKSEIKKMLQEGTAEGMH